MASLFDSEAKKVKRFTLQYANPDGEAVELLKIDATRFEEHTMNATLTRHEVEDGSNISDNIVNDPRSLSVNGVITDSPITLLAFAAGNIAGATSNLTGSPLGKTVVTGATAKIGSELLSSGEGKPSKNAMDILEFIRDEKIPLTIIASLKTYSNMMLTKFSASQTPQNANSLDFRATFEAVRFVESEVVDIPTTATENEGNVPTRKDGKKVPAALDAATEAKGSSALFKIAGGLF